MKCYKITSETLEEAETPFEPDTVCVCTPDELIHSHFNAAPHTFDECVSPGPAKLEAYDGYDFILLNIVNENERYLTQRIGLYIMPKAIVFVGGRENRAVQDVLDAFAAGKTANLNITRILYAFFNNLTINDSEELEALEDEISDIEERVMKGATEDYIKDIVAMRKKLMFYKKYYEQLLDVAESIEENSNGILTPSAVRYFKMFTARVERLNRNILNLRDYITQVREAYQSQVDIGLNAIMKLFTVITAVFLPLTLLVGWYGMNFKYMPELQWQYGYVFVACLSVAIVVVCFIFFKKKKML
nr:CorA family divalent cation transporter [uncultured Caproiciproducens sp.]